MIWQSACAEQRIKFIKAVNSDHVKHVALSAVIKIHVRQPATESGELHAKKGVNSDRNPSTESCVAPYFYKVRNYFKRKLFTICMVDYPEKSVVLRSDMRSSTVKVYFQKMYLTLFYTDSQCFFKAMKKSIKVHINELSLRSLPLNKLSF